jgi:hypothetical protein
VRNTDRIASRIGDLGEPEAELATLVQDCTGVQRGLNVGPHAADMPHLVQDSALLCQQQQQCET